MMVTYGVRDAFLLAHYRYDIRSKRLIRMSKLNDRTQFLVLRDGRLVFEGPGGAGLVDGPLPTCFPPAGIPVHDYADSASEGIPNQADFARNWPAEMVTSRCRTCSDPFAVPRPKAPSLASALRFPAE
jgi:hypothetical protein